MSAILAVDDSQSGTRTPRPHQVEVLDLAALQLRRDVITARNAAKVEELARRPGDRRPPKCSGAIPPLAQIIAETDQTSAV
ncbi:hypothetical protein D2E70_24970 [Mycobacteroides abscessus]|nr:hypothetical protein D2E70_24970 [Mycobacteroides abscessus]